MIRPHVAVVAILLAAAAAALPARTPRPPKDAAASELRTGAHMFDKWCAPCHGPDPRLAGTLALQTKYRGELPAALEQRTDLTPETVAYFVRHGVAWMAPFRKTEISDRELDALGLYLSTPAAKRGMEGK